MVKKIEKQKCCVMVVFHQKKVSWCPCLTYIINQLSPLKICRYCNIKRAIEDLRQGNGGEQVYNIRVDSKKNVVFMLCEFERCCNVWDEVQFVQFYFIRWKRLLFLFGTKTFLFWMHQTFLSKILFIIILLILV